MSNLRLRVWLMVSVALASSAVIIRLAWELTFHNATGTIVIVALLILATLSIYALFLYLTIKPSWKKVRSLPVRVWFTVITTACLISGVIHFIRFVPSPEAASPLSVVIASLLLLAGISAYLLALLFVWSIWKTKI